MKKFKTLSASTILLTALSGCQNYFPFVTDSSPLAKQPNNTLEEPSTTQADPQVDPGIWSHLKIGLGFSSSHQPNRNSRSAKNQILASIKNSEEAITYIIERCLEENIPTEVALIPIIKSQYDPLLQSYDGKAGIWQLSPSDASPTREGKRTRACA